MNKVVPLDADFFNAVEFANEKQKAQLDAFLDLRTEAQYQNACRDLEQCKYEKARLTFDLLGDYKDAADKANECNYQLSLLEEQNTKIANQRTTITDLNNRRAQLDLKNINNSQQTERAYQTLRETAGNLKKTKVLLIVTLCNWITGCLACLSMVSYSDQANTFGSAMIVLYFCLNVVFIILWIQYLEYSTNYTKNRKTTEIILSFLFPFIFHIIALIRTGKDMDAHQFNIANIQAILTKSQHESDRICAEQNQIGKELAMAKDDLETANNTVRKIRGESVGRTENSFEIPEIDKPNKNANIETVLTELLEEPDETKGR